VAGFGHWCLSRKQLLNRVKNITRDSRGRIARSSAHDANDSANFLQASADRFVGRATGRLRGERGAGLRLALIDAARDLLIMTANGPLQAIEYPPENDKEAGMIEALEHRVNSDQALVRRGRYLSTTFLLEVGQAAWLVKIFEGRIVSVTPGPFVMPSASFALRAAADEWTKFWSIRPPPGSNDLMALIKRRVLRAEGDLQILMANLRYFKEVLAKLRQTEGVPA
jgi:hypothetical protein